ncbi:hypothetical protein GCM10011505_34120 [Tistrella bauzanensis]|uniref:Uncharacterized protein n=1 Tax=Tistrella bauzanensis TaxID=657419 RepID=A0ABQ1IRN9_9PROT|nr:hypothetical protein GCM10011505_34120 [Tistrella bauzanensis]
MPPTAPAAADPVPVPTPGVVVGLVGLVTAPPVVPPDEFIVAVPDCPLAEPLCAMASDEPPIIRAATRVGSVIRMGEILRSVELRDATCCNGEVFCVALLAPYNETGGDEFRQAAGFWLIPAP